MNSVAPGCQLAFEAESDSKRYQLDEHSLSDLNPNCNVWQLHRHRAGPDSFAQLVILRKSIRDHVRRVKPEGRCAGILLSIVPIEPSVELMKATAS
jgi:hypothetical protein